MAGLNIGTLPRITAPALSQRLLDPTTASKLSIIDVRDSDHIGGHIKGSMHVPTNTHDFKMPELVRTLKDKDTVVFHCMLSQQRGPSSALKYARERERMLGAEEGKCLLEGEEGSGQRVVVLEKGFGGWQQL